jgi:hypothetical protein
MQKHVVNLPDSQFTLFNHLLEPDLNELSPKDLLDHFKRLGEEINLCIERQGTLKQLHNYQVQLACVKQQIHKKARIPVDYPFQRAYAVLFLS